MADRSLQLSESCSKLRDVDEQKDRTMRVTMVRGFFCLTAG